MFKIVQTHVVRHLSLLMILAGALGFFISNFLLKEILDANQYGQYSIFVSYFSLIYLFGIFGTEQVFLRFSFQSKKNTIQTQKLQLYLVGGISIFSSMLSTFIMKVYYPEIPINTVLLLLSSFCMIGTLFLLNMLRLNSDFVLSQFVSNYWKMVLFATTAFFYLFHKCNLADFIQFVAINMILVFIVASIYIYKNIKIEFNEEVSGRDIGITAFHFFLAIFGFSLINFADRFIIEAKFSISEFGDFFYLTNFFLAPFTILQNYIGFKQLIVFKDKFDKEYYIRFNQKAIAFGFLLGIALYISSYVLCFFKVLKFNFSESLSIISLLLLLGIVRLYSSSIISAFEARTSMESLRKSNIYILLITVLVLFIAIIFGNSIEPILICIISIWAFRCFVHRQLILCQMKNES